MNKFFKIIIFRNKNNNKTPEAEYWSVRGEVAKKNMKMIITKITTESTVGVEAPRKCRSEESSPSTATVSCDPPKNSWHTQFLLEVIMSCILIPIVKRSLNIVFAIGILKLQLYRDPGLTVLVSNNSEPQPRWDLDRLSPGHHYTARLHFLSKKI